MKKIILPLTLLVISFMLTSCFTTKAAIKDIRTNPDRYSGKKVVIEGIVTDSISVPVSGGVVFRIFGDNNSSLWVYSEGEQPNRGDKVKVIGQVSNSDTLRGKFTGPYIIEEKRSSP